MNLIVGNELYLFQIPQNTDNLENITYHIILLVYKFLNYVAISKNDS